MCSYGEPPLRTRYVLPFVAAPIQLHVLRRTVREQLRGWNASALADEAQLAVTELATNVIKHVGSGAPATLVLEPTEDRLRIEMHDTSQKAPTRQPQNCGQECGRGLHLLAAMSMDWGAVVTATGKTVWCELPLPQDGPRLRVHRASTVLDTYQDLPGTLSGLNVSRPPTGEESATHLIADLLHWLAAHGGDPDTILDHAQAHYEAELDKAG
ncbi:ATP-binding protein [Streptomyces sp. NPDC096310]|uniref:ATP-binding protein n=1 Tax=Streptomyces sp. NPDC096310 TaxID=3366082 RepID=UPI0038155A03